MVRYQSNQSIKKQIEQRQLLSIRSPSLRTDTVLRTKSKTALKTNTTHTNQTTKTKSRLKRKMMVYKKDGKFYIDNSAAYALKLTNVRAVMTENPHLIEIGIETLYRFQNNEDIEIEYQELDKEIKKEKTDLLETLEGLEQGEYGVGIHGIDKGSREEKQGIADSISNEGLNINNNSKTILSTSISLGTNEDMQRISREISGYQFGNGTKANIIIAVPLYIQNESGETIFLGFPEQNKRTAGQQYDEHCILDRICSKMKKIPPQFILGYYCENQDGSESFIKNGQHYSNLSIEDREVLFTEISSNMDDISRNYNELIASGNIGQLSQIKERMQQLGWNSSLIDNALTLAQKYKEKEISQDVGKRNTRQIILNTNEQSDNSSSPQRKNVRRVILDHSSQSESLSASTKSKRIRRILLDACKGTKLSDIAIAKETLREGLDEPEKDYKGKEV